VTSIEHNVVTVVRNNGEPQTIPAANVIWAAGVRASR